MNVIGRCSWVFISLLSLNTDFHFLFVCEVLLWMRFIIFYHSIFPIFTPVAYVRFTVHHWMRRWTEDSGKCLSKKWGREAKSFNLIFYDQKELLFCLHYHNSHSDKIQLNSHTKGDKPYGTLLHFSGSTHRGKIVSR